MFHIKSAVYLLHKRIAFKKYKQKKRNKENLKTFGKIKYLKHTSLKLFENVLFKCIKTSKPF